METEDQVSMEEQWEDLRLVWDPYLMNRIPAHITTMLQQDTPQLLPIHWEFYKTWPIWEQLMQCFTLGQALDLTYIYNRKFMRSMIGANLDWTYVLETNSLGLALFMCEIGKEPNNVCSLVQTAFDRGYPWLVYVLLRRFPKPMTLVLDVGWTKFKPIPMEGRVENCMALIKSWATKNYDRSIWSLLIPKHYVLNSVSGFLTILEMLKPPLSSAFSSCSSSSSSVLVIPLDLLWEHRRTGNYLNQQTIAALFQAGVPDEVKWDIVMSEPGWGACIVDVSYQCPTSPALRDMIRESWPECKPSMGSWIMALRRGDRHAIQSIRQLSYWPKEALLAVLQSKAVDMLDIIQELESWHVHLKDIMCDHTIGQAILCTKNDDLMLHVLRQTNNSCYHATLENHQLLIQCRMLSSLIHLHLQKLQLFTLETFTMAVSEGFCDLVEILLKRVHIPTFDDTLWYEQLLHIFVTQGQSTTGQKMTRLLLDHIPPNTPLSDKLQAQIKLSCG